MPPPTSRIVARLICLCMLIIVLYAEGFAIGGMQQRRGGASSSSSSSVVASEPSTAAAATEYGITKRAARAKALNSYSFVDFLIGPEKSDIQAVDMPSELKPWGQTILRATSHLLRKERIEVLQALIWAYDAYRLNNNEGVKPQGTVGEFLSRVTQVVVMLGESEVDHETICAALLCQSPVTPEEAGVHFGTGVQTILKGWTSMLRVEGELEIKALIYDYAKRLWGEEGDNLRNLLILVAKDWRSVALRGE